MLLPMPAMPMQSGPPSEYLKARQSLTLAILILQTVVCIARMCLLLDIMGGFIMAICVGFGWYAYKDDMNITFLCYWGMMCLINGAFDLVRLIDFWVKSPQPFFDASLGLLYNCMSATLLAVPLVTLAGAVLAWYMYKNHSESDTGVYEPAYGMSRGGGNRERDPLMGRGATRPAASFTAFEGQGQRLGS
mmetsp:Transcript_1709/g.4250  ORF Transcript_1709/g.4250 Transcript_1709/m.4250 type:complete len:190 (-) Transcript_1709:58-627(-)